MTRTILAAITSICTALWLTSHADACAIAGPPNTTISITGENAVIVWDAKHHREDFVRRADFDTEAANFGFLVPVPSMPTLAEADDEVFEYLTRIVHPVSRMAGGMAGAAPPPGAEAPTSVTVLQTQEVAGYDAAVLAASDTGALKEWLRRHGYATPEGFDDWMSPYLAAHYKIVAFKFSKSAQSNDVRTRLVRISFDTNRPFYPYREPYAEHDPNRAYGARTLRLFVLSAEPEYGRLGSEAGIQAWPGRILGVYPLGDFNRIDIGRYLALNGWQIPKNLTMTAFEDDSSPRPGLADIWFSNPPVRSRTARR